MRISIVFLTLKPLIIRDANYFAHIKKEAVPNAPKNNIAGKSARRKTLAYS